MNKQRGFIFIAGAAWLYAIVIIAAGVAATNSMEEKAEAVSASSPSNTAGPGEIKIAATDSRQQAVEKSSCE